MNITVNVDITPEELRRFMGLPDVQGLQEEMLKMAHKQLTESGQNAFNDILAGAVQPMMAYQDWLQRMMLGSLNTEDAPESKKKGGK
jgi:hypothetical protein